MEETKFIEDEDSSNLPPADYVKIIDYSTHGRLVQRPESRCIRCLCKKPKLTPKKLSYLGNGRRC